MADEKIYTVPLRKGFLKAPKYARTGKAVKVLKSYLLKHLKKEVKIGKHLNLELWKDGRKNPPGKIKIRIDEIGDKTIAELINAPKLEVKEEKDDKISIKKPKILGGGKDKETKTETEKVVEEIKKEEKEKTEKAIKDVPKIQDLAEEKKEKEVEKKHAHRKQEKIIAGKE